VAQVCSAQISIAEVRLGQVRLPEARLGEVRPAQVCPGEVWCNSGNITSPGILALGTLLQNLQMFKIRH
jgi:hypothetical protein